MLSRLRPGAAGGPGAAGPGAVWRRSHRCATVQSLAPSSSGLGRRPLKAVAPVQIRSGLLTKEQVTGLVITYGDRALIIRPSFVREFRRHASSCIVSERHGIRRSPIPRHLGIGTTGQPGYRLHNGLWDTEGRFAAGMLSGWAVWCQAFRVNSEELLDQMSRLRCAPMERAHLRASHKQLMLV